MELKAIEGELCNEKALANRIRRKLMELKEAVDEAAQSGITTEFKDYEGKGVNLYHVAPDIRVEL